MVVNEYPPHSRPLPLQEKGYLCFLSPSGERIKVRGGSKFSS
jgi:hypothetical protein